MRLLICAGGTGGGVYPALAVLQAMQGSPETLWVGGEGGMEAHLVERNGIPFKAIPAAGVHGVGLKTLPRNLWQLGRGVLASRRILKEFKPDVLFFTGGYVAVPMALAGGKVPTCLYVPDIEPGLALRTLARFADRILITAETSKSYFSHPEKVRLTGYPTRADLGTWSKDEAMKALELNEEFPVLLILGGSKGARSINQAVLSMLPKLLEKLQVLHITGELDWQDVEEKTRQLNGKLAARYHAFAYLHEQMGAALAAADLVVSRAGASTLGEYPLFGLPAILVPYPYAWRYQKVNADFLTGHGAALMIEDGNLAKALLPAVEDLFTHPEKLTAMHDAMLALRHTEAAAEIGKEIETLGEQRRKPW